MKYMLKESIKVRCCDSVLKKGEIISIYTETSPNRILILTERNTIHKIKKSTLNRVGEPLCN